MKPDTDMLLERFGRYCMWNMPNIEDYVTEAQQTKDVKHLLERVDDEIDRLRGVVAEIRKLEGIEK